MRPWPTTASRLHKGVSELKSRSSSRIGDTGRRVVKDEVASRSIRGVRVTASETGYPWPEGGYACATSHPTCSYPPNDAANTGDVAPARPKTVRDQGYHRALVRTAAERRELLKA